jgi:hypothetical protein
MESCYSIESSQILKGRKFYPSENQIVDVKKMTC